MFLTGNKILNKILHNLNTSHTVYHYSSAHTMIKCLVFLISHWIWCVIFMCFYSLLNIHSWLFKLNGFFLLILLYLNVKCYLFCFLITTQQTACPVKRVELQLSGSNLHPTMQSTVRGQETRDNGWDQFPRDLGGLILSVQAWGRASSLQDTKRQGAGDSPRDLKKHLLRNFKWKQ